MTYITARFGQPVAKPATAKPSVVIPDGKTPLQHMHETARAETARWRGKTFTPASPLKAGEMQRRYIAVRDAIAAGASSTEELTAAIGGTNDDIYRSHLVPLRKRGYIASTGRRVLTWRVVKEWA